MIVNYHIHFLMKECSQSLRAFLAEFSIDPQPRIYAGFGLPCSKGVQKELELLAGNIWGARISNFSVVGSCHQRHNG